MLIITADDFGWTDGHNLAVARAHRAGLLSRASLLCNGGAFAGAVALAAELPTLGVGVHLTLSEGRPLLPPGRLPHLTRADGSFHDRVLPLVLAWRAGRLLTEEAQAEWRAQIERALQAGIRVSHLDSHKHVHLLPPLLPAIIALAREYRVPYVRLPLPPLTRSAARRAPGFAALRLLAMHARRRLREAGVAFPDHFFGFAESGEMTAERLLAILSDLPPGVVEIMVHPAVLTEQVQALRRRYAWARRYRFETELAALCDPRVVGALGGALGEISPR